MLIYLNVAVEQLFINHNTPLIIHNHSLNFKNWWSLRNDNKKRSSLSLSLRLSLIITHIFSLRCTMNFFTGILIKK